MTVKNGFLIALTEALNNPHPEALAFPDDGTEKTLEFPQGFEDHGELPLQFRGLLVLVAAYKANDQPENDQTVMRVITRGLVEHFKWPEVTRRHVMIIDDWRLGTRIEPDPQRLAIVGVVARKDGDGTVSGGAGI